MSQQTKVRGLESLARSQRFDLANAVHNLNNQVADLHSKVDALQAANATLIKARADYGREQQLYQQQVISKQEFDSFQEDIDAIFDEISKNAPDTKQAEAKLNEAQANLNQAELNLSYCDVVADIDGVVTRRNVNPGDQVLAGQGLMALRSLTDIWVDANFKETQLANLRIGQPVELDVDMYGSHRHFQGRVSGFTMGTGSTSG